VSSRSRSHHLRYHLTVAKLGEAVVEVRADAGNFRVDLDKQVTEGLKGVTGQLDKLEKDSRSSFTKVTDSLTKTGKSMTEFGKSWSLKVTAPIVGLGTAAVLTAGNFEAAMNKVRAVTGATDEGFKALSDQAKMLGSTTKFSASEAADAMGFLGMAGFKTEQIIGAMPSTLQLAAAANMGLAQAADITSNVMSGFGMTVDELGGANDALVKTLTRTNTDLSQLGQAFKFVGPVAKGAGVSFNETAAAIGLLGNAGIQASMAGTSLRGAITALINPTSKTRDIMESLGITALDSSGNLLPLNEIIEQLETSGASTADMMGLFGQRAGPAMMALVEQGSTALRDLTKELDESGGTAERIAAIQMEGFNGKMTEMKSAIEGLLIAVGESGLLDFMTAFVGKIVSLIQGLTQTNPAVMTLITVLAGLLAIVGPIVLGLGMMLTALSAVIVKIKAAEVALKKFFVTMSTGNAVVLALTAAVTVAVMVFGNWNAKKKEAAERAQTFADAIKQERDGMEGATAELIANSLATERNQKALTALGLSAGDIAKVVAGESVPAYAALRAEYDALTPKGQSVDVTTRKLQERFGDNAVAVRNLFREVDQLSTSYTAGTKIADLHASTLGDVEKALTKTDEATEALKAQHIQFREGMRNAAKQTDANRFSTEAYQEALKEADDALRSLINTTLESFNSDLAYRNQVERTTKAVEDYTKELANSELTQRELEQATRDVEGEILRQAAAAVESANKFAEMSGSSLTAQQAQRILIDELNAVRQTLAPGSQLRRNIDDYITVLESQVPEEVSTDFTVDSSPAMRELEKAKRLANEEAVRIGLEINAGIVAGLAQNQNLVYAAAGMVDTVVATAKSRAGISSPSRLFADEVGAPIAEGVADGITSMAFQVKDAMVAIVDDLTVVGLNGLDDFNASLQDVLKTAQDAYKEVWDTIKGRRSQEQATARVTDAEESLADANRRVTDATDAVSEAQAELTRIQLDGSSTSKQIADAQRNLDRAQRDLTKATNDVERSTKSLQDANFALLQMSEHLLEQGPESIKNFENIAKAAGLETDEIAKLVARYNDLAASRTAAAEAARKAAEVDKEIANVSKVSATDAANEAVRQAVADRDRLIREGKNPGAAENRAAQAAINAAQVFAQASGATAGSKAYAQKQLDALRFITASTPWLGGPLKGVMEALSRQIGLANGAIVNGARLSVIGEAGPEAVIPLGRPRRAMQLMEQSGLADMVRNGSGALVNIQSATFATPSDADLVAQKVNSAYRARVLMS
jgi:TP901 family phage tail tape measure protein